MDGTVSEFSEIVEVTLPSKKDLSENELYAEVKIWEDDEKTIDLFPNPVTTRLTLNYKVEGVATMTVFNTSGQRVIERTLVQGETIHRLDVSNLDKGVYVVSIREAGYRSRHERIIKL